MITDPRVEAAARALYIADRRGSSSWPDWDSIDARHDRPAVLRLAAAALAAADAVQPDTVTTAEELEALPVGSVVIEGDDGSPQPWVFGVKVMPGVFHRFPDGWYVVAGHGARTDLGLPATVLYRPAGDGA